MVVTSPQKIEKSFIVSGKLRVFLTDVTTHERKMIEIAIGQKITIYPVCAHKFQAITLSQVIGYYPRL